MPQTGFTRISSVAAAGRSVGMAVAVVAALLLGVAAASYARDGGDDGGGGVGQAHADPSVR